MHEGIDVPSMLQAITSRYNDLLSAKQQDVLPLPPAYSGPLDDRTTEILKESGLCLDQGLAYIDADISHLTDALRQLTENRRLLYDLRRKCRAALYPISILLLEILTDILCYAASEPINIFDTKHPAWAISKVCQLWRTIITTICPEAWTRILVPCVSNRARMLKDDALSLVLGAVLSRSQTHRIDFTMKFNKVPAVFKPQNDIWAALALHVERWEKLDLSIRPPDAGVLGYLRGRLSSLRVCVLHFYANEGGYNSLIDAFEYTPELTHMDLKGVAPDALAPSTAPKLESFKYRVNPVDEMEWYRTQKRVSLEYFFSIIRNSPKLAVVDILCEPSSPNDTVSPRIMSPMLSKLVVNNTAFLRSLLAPALKEVTLAEDSDPERSPIPGSTDFFADFHKFLVESHCSTLSRLNMSIDHLDHHLLSILQLAPALISFQLKTSGAWRNDAVVQELIVQLTEVDVFLPRLEEIELNLLTGEDWAIHCADCAMVNMVAAQRHRSLQKFCFVAEFATLCNLGKDDVKRLEDFKVDGLDVTLRSMYNRIPADVSPAWGPMPLRTPSPNS
ncbi:hypothetical protein ARMSODRAFT_1024053 [Armillaria solidipes]|uniref:F-box domain-containing protein n=1 Tax=Armillaria solidipes TaxID=1076256 RepID=A0A2H3BB86_9AGAR|nr:hypothetical protein ARMSODRAFT_1024053 [Armillaria solidipes]